MFADVKTCHSATLLPLAFDIYFICCFILFPEKTNVLKKTFPHLMLSAGNRTFYSRKVSHSNQLLSSDQFIHPVSRSWRDWNIALLHLDRWPTRHMVNTERQMTIHVRSHLESPADLTPLTAYLDCGRKSEILERAPGRTCQLCSVEPWTFL